MRNKIKAILLFLLSVLLFQNCGKIEIIDPVGFETIKEADSIIFAVIGDYGKSGDGEKAVADMVKNWNPDFIITTGDNNYYEGKYSTIKKNITQYYGDFIYNYDAPDSYKCNGRAFDEGINRFFPTPGNHDANNKNKLAPYLNFFTLPGLETYYKFIWGPVTFYSINSESGNIDLQKSWLYGELEKSETAFNIVYFHHSPWTPGPHSNEERMRWDFQSHSVDVVFTGHDHIYARIEKFDEEGLHYIVNGLGGSPLHTSSTDALPSELFDVFLFYDNYGAIKAKATYNCLEIRFYSISDKNTPIDSLFIFK